MNLYEKIKMKQRNCPDRENHTVSPDGYVAFFDWCKEMSKTHKQRKCKSCGFFVIWEKKKVRIA